ncbi:hypothetical protein LINPERHAP1_LOCUS29478, partial [Linum perenne]
HSTKLSLQNRASRHSRIRIYFCRGSSRVFTFLPLLSSSLKVVFDRLGGGKA